MHFCIILYVFSCFECQKKYQALNCLVVHTWHFLRVMEYIAKGVWLCITLLCKAYEALLKYDVIFERDVLRFANLLGFGVYVSPPVISL